MGDLLRVNCGSASILLPGYLNLDSNEYGDCPPESDTFKLCDLRNGIPFPDDSCYEVRGDQFIEHLTPEEMVAFFTDAWRVLVPGGMLDLRFPDIGAFAQQADVGEQDDYAAENNLAPPLRVPSALWSLDALAHREWGHKTTLTAALVGRMLCEAGWMIWHCGVDETCGHVVAYKP
jgi:predicted SAM-dependent methyltransferase